MQENKHDTNGAHVFHQEKVNMEQAAIIECPPIGKFITHNLMRHKPSDKNTGQEAHDRQEQLSSNEVEKAEQ